MKKTLIVLGTLFLVLVLAYIFHTGGTREGVNRGDVRKFAAPTGEGLNIGDRNTRVMNSKGNLRVDGDGDVLTLNGNKSGLRLRDPTEAPNGDDLVNENGNRFTFDPRPGGGGGRGPDGGDGGDDGGDDGGGGLNDPAFVNRQVAPADHDIGEALNNMITPDEGIGDMD